MRACPVVVKAGGANRSGKQAREGAGERAPAFPQPPSGAACGAYFDIPCAPGASAHLLSSTARSSPAWIVQEGVRVWKKEPTALLGAVYTLLDAMYTGGGSAHKYRRCGRRW